MNRQKKSFSSFEKTLNLSPEPSRLLFIYILLAHTIAIIAILLSPLPGWCAALFLGGLVASWVFSIKSAKKIYPFQLTSNNEWLLCTEDKQHLSVKPSPATRCFASIILLILQDKNKRNYRILLLPDSISPIAFRQLKARLVLWHLEQNSVV